MPPDRMPPAAAQSGEYLAVSSLRQNLEWLFALIALIGAGLLAWGLYGQWQDIG